MSYENQKTPPEENQTAKAEAPSHFQIDLSDPLAPGESNDARDVKNYIMAARNTAIDVMDLARRNESIGKVDLLLMGDPSADEVIISEARQQLKTELHEPLSTQLYNQLSPEEQAKQTVNVQKNKQGIVLLTRGFDVDSGYELKATIYGSEEELIDDFTKDAGTKLLEVVEQAPRFPERSRVAKISNEDARKFSKALEELGVTADVPTTETIQAGINKAKALVHSNKARDRLLEIPIINNNQMRMLFNNGSSGQHAELDEPIYIDSSKIAGVSGFDTWLGHGKEGTEIIKDRQTGEPRTSFETILEYATRDTQLPGITSDGTVYVFLSEDSEPILIADNAHRVAAAKLRGEPLKVTNFALYKG